MDKNTDLNLLKPRLRKCNVYAGDSKIVLEDPKTQGQLVLPKAHQKIIDLFDGEKSVKEITSELYNSHGTVSFNSIITTIHLLNDAGLLEGAEDALGEVNTEKSPHEQKPSILIRALWKKTLVPKFGSPKLKSIPLFLALVSVIIAGVVLSHNLKVWEFKFDTFLKVNGHYNSAFIRLLIITSALLTAKTLIKCLLLMSCVGNFYQLGLRVNPFSFSLNVGENSIYAQDKKFILIIYGISTALIHIFLAAVFTFMFKDSAWANDVKILAVLLTLIELDPYKQSELTKVFNFFYAEDQLKSMTPYLKNCSLSNVIDDGESKMADEVRFYIYSLLAITWAVAFTLFSIDLMVANLPALFLEMQIGELAGQVSSGIVTFMLVFMFGYLFMDLMHTLFNNIVSPFLAPLSGIFQKSKDYESDDLTDDVLIEELGKNSFFNNMSKGVLEYIVQHAELKKLKKGKNLFVQGADAEHFYFLLEGQVEVNFREKTGRTKTLVQLPPHSVIGEMAILKDTVRTANVVAMEDIIFLEIDVEDFRELMEKEDLKGELGNIKSRVEISQFVSSAGLFNDFPPEVMNVFVEAGDLVLFPADEEIVTQGEDDKTFYLLIRGSVEIMRNNEFVAELGQGDFFGEIALIADSPRTASVKTKEECLFLYIENKRFWKILSDNIDLAMYIESIGRHRLEKAS